jgi:peptidylprolyl isomerase
MMDEAKKPGPAPGFFVAVIMLAVTCIAVGVWVARRDGVQHGKADAYDLGPGAVTTPSGLRWRDLVVGTGASPEKGQTVFVHYDGRLIDGTVFDSSRTRGKVFDFRLGMHDVIAGWDEGVASMHVGGVRRLVVPPDLGYGPAGSPPKIPPNATLVFVVELKGIK